MRCCHVAALTGAIGFPPASDPFVLIFCEAHIPRLKVCMRVWLSAQPQSPHRLKHAAHSSSTPIACCDRTMQKHCRCSVYCHIQRRCLIVLLQTSLGPILETLHQCLTLDQSLHAILLVPQQVQCPLLHFKTMPFVLLQTLWAPFWKPGSRLGSEFARHSTGPTADLSLFKGSSVQSIDLFKDTSMQSSELLKGTSMQSNDPFTPLSMQSSLQLQKGFRVRGLGFRVYNSMQSGDLFRPQACRSAGKPPQGIPAVISQAA